MLWDPFEEIIRMQQEMDRLFSNFYDRGKALPDKSSKEVTRIPVTELKETDKEVIATFEIPGASKEDIDLNVADTGIEVKAQQKHEKEEKGKDFYGYRSVSRSFYRKLPLPSKVKSDAVHADYANGVLRIVMPKAEAAKQNRIVIK